MVTTFSCLNTKNISTKYLTSDRHIPMQKHKKYIKRVNLNPPKPNKSTATLLIVKWMKSQTKTQKMIIRMVNKIKQDMNKHLNELQKNPAL
jgi:hypothetical protein